MKTIILPFPGDRLTAPWSALVFGVGLTSRCTGGRLHHATALPARPSLALSAPPFRRAGHKTGLTRLKSQDFAHKPDTDGTNLDTY
jgi:hypothetical protein